MKKKDMQNLMKQAEEMQARMQSEMAQASVEATSGGGMVTVTMNGSKKLLTVKIQPDVVDADDVEMLQDLVLTAVNEAGSKVDELLSSQLGGMTGGLLGF